MRFALTADQKDYFTKHGSIEFEGVVAANLSAEQVAVKRAMAEVAAELTGVRPLRLGWVKEVSSGELNLKEMGSVQGVVAAALVKPSGNVIFFPADHTFSLAEDEASGYILVAYAGPGAVYIHNERDPDTHALKKKGYVFGDRLREETHPTLTK